MTTSDLDKLLASAAQPMSWRQAVDAGVLVDCTKAAAWTGFVVPAVMTVAAWDEVVGSDAHPTRAEHDDMGTRLQRVWTAASNETARYRRDGVNLSRITFRAPSCGPFGKRRMVSLALVCRLHRGSPFLTLSLECEA